MIRHGKEHDEKTGRRAPGCAALFMGFLQIGLSGFGGVLPWARRMIVEQRGWLDDRAFTEVLSFCQFLPGPNIANVAVCIGARFRDPAGAVAAFCGLMLAPVVIVLLLATLYGRYGQAPALRGLFSGVSAAAAGLVVATGIRMATGLRRKPAVFAITATAFAAVGLLGLPLVWVIAVLAPVGIAAAWFRWM